MPEREGSSADSSIKAYAYSTKPSSVRGPETVMHSSRQPTGRDEDSHPQPDSSVWRRLFPVEGEAADAASPLEGPAGCTLEHFEIEERIGMGGMGAVFRALDKRLDRVVALKVLAPTQAHYEGTLLRFQNEARAAARLDHDNIARVFYIGSDRELHFIAYEYVTGTNIRDMIRRRGGLDPGEAVNYTMQIASALNHTFAAGVVHRDIKPSNIIISPNGRAKLVDLGLARKQLTAASQELTTAGTTLGTFDYIAPEQAKDPRHVDVRSDIYSLGCTLYHMLTGEPPYPDGTMLQKLLDHQGKASPDPAAKNQNVSPELAAICRKMMASDADRRYATPDELIRDLAVVASGMGLRGVNPEGVIWTRSRVARRPFWERHAGLIATTAILFAVVLVLTVVPDIRQRADSLTSIGGNDPMPDDAPGASVDSGAATTNSGPRNPDATGDGSLESPRNFEPTLAPASGDANRPFVTTLPNATPSEGGSESRGPSSGDPLWPLSTKSLIPDYVTHLRSPVEAPRPQLTEALETTTSRMIASDAERRALEDATPLPVTETAPPQISVVSKAGGEPRNYESLEAACADAPSDSIIELKFNGPRGQKERPLTVSNKRVTIRGARGYRPLLEFEPLAYPDQQTLTRMITVSAGSVELNNVDIDMFVEEQIETDLWAVFSVEGTDQVRLSRTIVSVVNHSGRPATVFELTDGPGRTDMDMMDEGQTDDEFLLSLAENIVRGDCSLIRTDSARAGRVEIDHALIGLSRPLLEINGYRDTSDDVSSDLELQIEHATCVLGGGLLQIRSSQQADHLLTVRISARSNVFASHLDVPLVAMSGQLNMGEFRELLSWNGSDNFYERFETFWKIEPARSLSGFSDFDYNAWKNYWGTAATGGSLESRIISRSYLNRPLASIEPRDVALIGRAGRNPAAEAAPDQSDAGVDHSRLPAPR